MQGVERYKVRLLAHDPQWEHEYLLVEQQLRAVWGNNIIAVQHVGSTAITGIVAKPILDVAVLLRDIAVMDREALVRCGYEYRGIRDGRSTYQLFVLRSDAGLSLRHIHCYDQSDREFHYLVGFRDYLNTHPQKAAEYAGLKQELAKRYPDDRVAYTQGKKRFIKDIYALLDI